MGNCELKDLLQELISKNVCLDTAAKILWQLKQYMEDADISQKLIKEFCPATTEK